MPVVAVLSSPELERRLGLDQPRVDAVRDVQLATSWPHSVVVREKVSRPATSSCRFRSC